MKDIALTIFVVVIVVWGAWGIIVDYSRKYTGRCACCGKKSDFEGSTGFWLCEECRK